MFVRLNFFIMNGSNVWRCFVPNCRWVRVKLQILGKKPQVHLIIIREIRDTALWRKSNRDKSVAAIMNVKQKEKNIGILL